MAFFAGLAVRSPELANPTLLVLTDRNDLDDQLFATFSLCHDLHPPDACNRPTSRDDLKRLLERSVRRGASSPLCRNSRRRPAKRIYPAADRPPQCHRRSPTRRTAANMVSTPNSIRRRASAATAMRHISERRRCPMPPSSASPARPIDKATTATRLRSSATISTFTTFPARWRIGRRCRSITKAASRASFSTKTKSQRSTPKSRRCLEDDSLTARRKNSRRKWSSGRSTGRLRQAHQARLPPISSRIWKRGSKPCRARRWRFA